METRWGWVAGAGIMVLVLLAVGVPAASAADGPSKGDAAVALRSARLYMKQQLWDKALEQLELAVRGDSTNAEAHFLLGELYADRDNIDLMNRSFANADRLKAAKYAKDIKGWREKVWAQHYNNGVRAFQKDKLDEALKEFTLAVKADPTRLDAHRNLGIAYLRMDKTDQGIAIFEEIVKADPKDKGSLVNLGIAYHNARKPEKELEAFQAAASLDPKSADIASKLIMGYEALAMATKDSVKVATLYDSAMAASDRAIALNPKDAKIVVNAGRLHLNRAMLHAAAGRKEEAKAYYVSAEKHLRSSVELDPKDGSSAYNLGVCYIQLDRLDDALTQFRRAVEIDPKDFDSAVQLGLIQVKRNEYEAAIETFKKITEIKPDHVRAWEFLASVYAQKDMAKEAKAAYDTAQALKGQGKN